MDWSSYPARCWFTYTDAMEGRKHACRVLTPPVKVDDYMAKVTVTNNDAEMPERELFADRVEVQVDGALQWVTVLSVWQEEHMPTDRPTPKPNGDNYSNLLKVDGSPARPRYCVTCSAIIPPTGKRGRPASKCVECRETK
jgi:hypothetical protein